MKTVDIVFDGAPSHDSPRFIEVERDGRSIKLGEWVDRGDGLWALRIPDPELETKPVFVAWTNTNLTDGYGHRVPHAVCESESTAIRLGKGKSVQGCDCEVKEAIAVRLDGNWLAPSRIESPSLDDERLDAQRAAAKAAIEKAKAAGLSDEDIAAMRR